MTRTSVTTESRAEQKPSSDLRQLVSDRQIDAKQSQSLGKGALTLSPLATPPRSTAPTLMRRPASGLAVNQPGDIYEQEADRAAGEVMRMPPTDTAQRNHTSSSQDQLHRKCAGCKEEEEEEKDHKLHRKETGSGPTVAPPVVHEVLRSSGQPLDAGTRSFMEPRFGHDFSRVRVHTDARAAESARAVDALAYTVGSNIVFANAQYEPQNLTGRRLLSHELAHVIQQRGAQSILPHRESMRVSGHSVLAGSSTEATRTAVFRQVAPAPVARHTAAQIFGNPAAAPPVPGMTLADFKTYTQLQSDWFVEPSIVAVMRDFLWTLLLHVEEGPHILAGIGDVAVSALQGVAAADWAPLTKFCLGAHASGHTVRIFPPLPALADRIEIGRTLAALEALIPANVLEFTVSHVQLIELWNQGLLPILTQYWTQFEPHIEQNFTPVPGARGPEFDRVLAFVRALGVPGLAPLAVLRGAVPDERWVRNLHRFPLPMLLRLVANLGDVSGAKRLILVLHTGHDAAAAFQGAANLFSDLVLNSPHNLVLMIEGATSLNAITARIPNITATWGQLIGGTRHISQVLIAGHGSTQTVGMAGTGAPVVNDQGAVSYPEENLVAGQPVGAPPTPTTALLDALMHNMAPATARILYVGCLVGAARVPAGTAAAAIPGVVGAQQNLAAFTNARATAAGIPAGRVQAARASVGVGAITTLFNAAGNLQPNYPFDPNAFGPANTYTRSGREPEGVLRAAVEVGATNTVTAEHLLRVRLTLANTGDWYDRITRLMVRLALPPLTVPPTGVDLQRVNELANVAEVPFLIMWPQFDWINAAEFSTRLNPQPFAADVYTGLAATAEYINPAAHHSERLRLVIDQGRLALTGAAMAPTFLAGILATNLSANAIQPFLDLGTIAPQVAALLPIGGAPTMEQIRLALAWFSRDNANVNVRNFLTAQVLHPANQPAAFTPAVSAAIQAAGLTDREILDQLGFAPNAAAAPAVAGAAPLPIANLALPGSATNTLLVSGHPYLAHVIVPQATLRNGPAIPQPSFAHLPNGSSVRIMGFSGGWAAADVNGRLGFIVQGELSPPPP